MAHGVKHQRRPERIGGLGSFDGAVVVVVGASVVVVVGGRVVVVVGGRVVVVVEDSVLVVVDDGSPGSCAEGSMIAPKSTVQ